MHSTQGATVTKFVRTFFNLSRQQVQPQQQTHAALLYTNCNQNNANKLSRPIAFFAAINCSQQQYSLSAAPPAMSSFTIKQQQRIYSKFTAAHELPVLGSHPLCEERAHDLVANLKDSERAAIKLALEKYDAMRQKEGFEGKLAATQWRTRFGRLSKMPALGEVDPTGSFCAFPDDWLKKKAAEKAKEPTRSELWRTFFVNAVPFVAFGFLDNFTMIVAGDYIEHVFGTFMCISTMAAAGFGNTISDVLGIGSAFYVERGCEFLGLRPPDLTPIQTEMKSCRRAANLGRIIGITVGCLVGMFPLLFMDKKPSKKDASPEDHDLTTTAVAQPQ